MKSIYHLIICLVMMPVIMEGSEQQDYNYYNEDYYDEGNMTEPNFVDMLGNKETESQPLEAITANRDNLPLFSDGDYDLGDYDSFNYANPNIGGDTSFSTMRNVSKIHNTIYSYYVIFIRLPIIFTFFCSTRGWYPLVNKITRLENGTITVEVQSSLRMPSPQRRIVFFDTEMATIS